MAGFLKRERLLPSLDNPLKEKVEAKFLVTFEEALRIARGRKGKRLTRLEGRQSIESKLESKGCMRDRQPQPNKPHCL